MDGSYRASKGPLDHLGHNLIIIDEVWGAAVGLFPRLIAILHRLISGLGARIVRTGNYQRQAPAGFCAIVEVKEVRPLAFLGSLQTGQVGPFGRIKAVSDHPAEGKTNVSH